MQAGEEGEDGPYLQPRPSAQERAAARCGACNALAYCRQTKNGSGNHLRWFYACSR